MHGLPALLSLAHVLGLVLGVGAATVKLVLLWRCRSDPGLVPAYLQAVRPITRLILAGLVLLTLSGLGWVLQGYPLRPRLIAKLVLVAGIWLIGPVIDKSAEPRFRQFATQPGSPAFSAAQHQYLTLEAIATGLFYAVIVLWMVF